jgi:hypothetical protein
MSTRLTGAAAILALAAVAASTPGAPSGSISCTCEITHVGPSGVVDARHGEDIHHGVVVPYPPPSTASRMRSGATAPARP